MALVVLLRGVNVGGLGEQGADRRGVLASQKNYMSLYLMCVYGDEATTEWFRSAFAASGKKLDMGKSCVRFKKLDDLPLDVIGQAIARVPAQAYIERIEESLRARGRGPKK